MSSELDAESELLAFRLWFDKPIEQLVDDDRLDDPDEENWIGIVQPKASVGHRAPRDVWTIKSRLPWRRNRHAVSIERFHPPRPDLALDGMLADCIEQVPDSDRLVTRFHAHGDCRNRWISKLSSPESRDNERPFCCNGWSLSIGPTVLSSLAWDRSCVVGWANFSLSGPGYFYPESFDQWVERCGNFPLLNKIKAACERQLPCSTDRAPRGVIKARQSIEHFDPLGEPKAPLRWTWGIGES